MAMISIMYATTGRTARKSFPKNSADATDFSSGWSIPSISEAL